MVRPNPRYGDRWQDLDSIWHTETPKDIWIDLGGKMTRNYAIEKRMMDEDIRVQQYNTNFKPHAALNGIGFNPTQLPMYGGSDYSNEDLIEYKKQAIEFLQAHMNLSNYRCHKYPRDPAFCGYAAEDNNKISLLQGSITRIGGTTANSGISSILESVLPSASAAEELTIDNNVQQIINDINNNVIQVPNWFQNNIEWVQTGHITEQEFLTAYNYIVDQQIAHAPTEPIIELPELLPEAAAQIEPIPIITPEINDSISTNMVTQQVINFNIVNGRAVGSIKFTSTDNFNPFYYGKNIINIVQFKTPNGVNILPYVKQNNLRFTETERDEIIHFDEDMKSNTRATIESFVWEWIDKPAGAFSNKYMVEISEPEPPKVIQTGIMGAGVAGAIGILILLGFVTGSRRKK